MHISWREDDKKVMEYKKIHNNNQRCPLHNLSGFTNESRIVGNLSKWKNDMKYKQAYYP